MATSKRSGKDSTDQLTFLSEEPPVRASASPAIERDWAMTVLTWPSDMLSLLAENGPSGWSGRTSPAHFPLSPLPTRTETYELDESGKPKRLATSQPSAPPFRNSGMVWRGECLTLNLSEWNDTRVPSPSDVGVSSLSDILETGDLPPHVYLSQEACAGILRRAADRGKTLPVPLEVALKAVASAPQTSTTRAPSSPKSSDP
jgi:hypothetical protein